LRFILHFTQIPNYETDSDITDRPKEIDRYITDTVANDPDLKDKLSRELVGLQNPTGNWDITQLAAKAVSGRNEQPLPNWRVLSNGMRTVTVDGAVYPQQEVNYYIYGVWVRVTGRSLTAAENRIVAYRIAFSRMYKDGLGIQGRVAWTRAGYYGDLTLAKRSAILGATPSNEKYTGDLSAHIGGSLLSFISHGNGVIEREP
jgi:hypothetical protein